VLLTFGWEGNYGVWRLDLESGALVKVSGQPRPVAYSPGAVWLSPLKGPTSGGGVLGPGSGDTLTRLDLTSEMAVDWFHRDNVDVRYLGSDASGNPWVRTYKFVGDSRYQPEILRVLAPGKTDLVLSGDLFSRVIADKHGTWFANESGVYLYSGGRVQRVSSASVGEVVGPCI
jgi:hypothetical protein